MPDAVKKEVSKKEADEKSFVLPSSKVEGSSKNAFGSRVVRHCFGNDPRPDNSYILRYGVKPRKDDPTSTTAVVIRKEYIPDLIHAAAKDVGIDAIMKQVSMGIRPMSSLVDDGNGNMDDTVIPPGSAPVEFLLEKEKEKSDKIVSDMGLDPDKVNSQNVEEIVNNFVKQVLAKQQALKTPEVKTDAK